MTQSRVQSARGAASRAYRRQWQMARAPQTLLGTGNASCHLPPDHYLSTHHQGLRWFESAQWLPDFRTGVLLGLSPSVSEAVADALGSEGPSRNYHGNASPIYLRTTTCLPMTKGSTPVRNHSSIMSKQIELLLRQRMMEVVDRQNLSSRFLSSMFRKQKNHERDGPIFNLKRLIQLRMPKPIKLIIVSLPDSSLSSDIRLGAKIDLSLATFQWISMPPSRQQELLE